MNGYKKMKRLAGMKVLKALSAVTALSMTVTSLAVSASANPVTPDVIANALGDLTSYGVVANSFTTASHFETNFAVNDLSLNNNFDVDKYVVLSDRKINFTVSTEESFAKDETKIYYFGIYCNGEQVDVRYGDETNSERSSDDYKGIIAVEFKEEGSKSFTITVPDEYKYETIQIFKMKPDEVDGRYCFTASEAPVELAPASSDEKELIQKNSACIVGNSMVRSSITIGTNKSMIFTPEVYQNLVFENDGRVSYIQDGQSSIFAEQGNTFISDENAGKMVDDLLAQVQEASQLFAGATAGNGKVILATLDQSIYNGDRDNKALIKLSNIPTNFELSRPNDRDQNSPEGYTFAEQLKNGYVTVYDLYRYMQNNPEVMLVLNVDVKNASDFTMDFNNIIDNWDVATSSRIINNFINCNKGITSIYFTEGIRGTIIAPDAKVTISKTMCGAVYADSVVNDGGEIHRGTYRSFVDSYSAHYFDAPPTTTPEVTTTPPEETTTVTTEPEETTTTTEPEVTTTTTEVTTTTTEPVVTTTTTPAPVVTTTTTPAPVVTTTTTPAPVVTTTTTPAPVVTTTTTPAPVVTTTTTPAPVVTTTTTPAPVVTTTTTPAPVVTTTTTPAPVVTTTTTPAPVVTTTTTPAPVVTTTTTTPAPVEEVTTTTTPAPVEEVTTTTTPVPVEEVTTTTPAPEEEVTTVTEPEPDVTTTVEEEETTTPVEEPTPEETTTTPDEPEVEITTTTTTVLIELEEEPPRDNLILIDEDIPLGDTPFNTGVDNHIGLFITIGSLALLVGVGAQVYTVILKKNN